ncbi:MAG: PD-(D/E)XK nuclease family protein [Pyrobaculum sp.]
MSLAEEIKRVLLERLEILVEVLTASPEIIYEALARSMPWQNLVSKENLRKLEGKVATKEDLKRLEERGTSIGERMAMLKEEKRKLWHALNALGVKWEVFSEDAFRSGVRELHGDAGCAVERWVYYDDRGYVYGYPSEVELDVVVRDGGTFAVEITSALRRGDLQQIRRKMELFSAVTGRKVDAVNVITPFIHDRNPDAVIAVANAMGINVVWPRPRLDGASVKLYTQLVEAMRPWKRADGWARLGGAGWASSRFPACSVSSGLECWTCLKINPASCPWSRAVVRGR